MKVGHTCSHLIIDIWFRAGALGVSLVDDHSSCPTVQAVALLISVISGTCSHLIIDIWFRAGAPPDYTSERVGFLPLTDNRRVSQIRLRERLSLPTDFKGVIWCDGR
jgi:hypothetical protein